MVIPPRTPDGYERKMTKGRVQETTQTTTNLCQHGLLQTTRKQTRFQAEVESIMDPSEHMEELLEA